MLLVEPLTEKGSRQIVDGHTVLTTPGTPANRRPDGSAWRTAKSDAFSIRFVSHRFLPLRFGNAQ